jgi:hypothetical protein
MASGVWKNKIFSRQIVIVSEFKWQLIGESGGLKARRRCHDKHRENERKKA